MSKLNNLEMPEVKPNNSKRVNNDGGLLSKDDVSIMDFVEPKTSFKREAVSVYFDEEVMNKLKTVSQETGVAISKMIENTIVKLTKDTEVNETSVKAYDKSNKRKTRTKKSN